MVDRLFRRQNRRPTLFTHFCRNAVRQVRGHKGVLWYVKGKVPFGSNTTCLVWRIARSFVATLLASCNGTLFRKWYHYTWNYRLPNRGHRFAVTSPQTAYFCSQAFLKTGVRRRGPFFARPRSYLAFVIDVGSPLRFLAVLNRNTVTVVRTSLSDITLTAHVASSRRISPLVAFYEPFLVGTLYYYQADHSDTYSSAFS